MMRRSIGWIVPALALLFVALNLLIDVIYTLVDPRVGMEG